MTQAERLFGRPQAINYPTMDFDTLCQLRDWLKGEMAVRRDRVKARKLLCLVIARIMEEENAI